jgi:hypothetical protein
VAGGNARKGGKGLTASKAREMLKGTKLKNLPARKSKKK